MPSFIQFDAAAHSDQRIYKKLSLPDGSYIVFDKGYNNYTQFAAFTHAGIYFITRQKDNAVFTDVVECLHDESSADNILKEAVIEQVYKDEEGEDKTLRLRSVALSLSPIILSWMLPISLCYKSTDGRLNCFSRN